ncbi:MAG: histidinol dehydrogenase, partial [Luteimonas sp.]
MSVDTASTLSTRRLRWSGLGDDARRAVLARPVQAVAGEVRDTVAALIDEVRAGGDGALRAITRRLDGVDQKVQEVGEAEFAAAEASLPPALRRAMAEAAARIERFHRAGMPGPYAVETAPGVVCERVVRPIGRVGLYVPAGSAPLPSTALMLAVPAGLAGCPQIVLCTPPRS